MNGFKAPSTAAGGFDRWSPTYDSSALQSLFFDKVHDALVAAMHRVMPSDSTARVLDIGCGTGRLLTRLRMEFPNARLAGVDPSQGMVDVARAKPELYGVPVDVGSSAALPIDTGSVDVLTSTMSFHHWEDQQAGMHEMSRALRPGCPLFVADAFSIGPLAPMVWLVARNHGVGMRTRRQLDAMLADADLERLAVIPILAPAAPLRILIARRPADR